MEKIVLKHKHFSDLPILEKGKARRLDIITLFFEILTWIVAIFTIFFMIIFNPTELTWAMPYIIFGMFLASAFWYLRIRTLYMKLNFEKLTSEVQFQKIRERQILLDKKEKEFIAMTSHQLNTPLSVIRNASAELVRESHDKTKFSEKLTEKFISRFQTINECSKTMVTYLNDLISLIRSDKAIMELNLRPIEARLIIEDSIPKNQEEIKNKKIEIKINIDPQIDKVICDQDRVITALTNLINNAILYSYSDSEVKINVIPTGNYAQFSIQNTGEGISLNEQPHIFSRFYRTTHAKIENEFGTGLGLSIARDIILQQGGTIWFESEPKKTTTFYFTLPKV